MSEQDHRDQWPESLRIMREQRERIKELEAALQDKCHNFPEADYAPFCDGCDGFQREKFGKCRTDELEEKVERLEAEVNRLNLLCEATNEYGLAESKSAEAEIKRLEAEVERLKARLHDLEACPGIPEVVQRNAALEENNRALTAEVERLRRFVGDEDFTSDYQTAGDMRREIERLTKDAERYRAGKRAWATGLMPGLWRFCEPDPLYGDTFDEAWDVAAARMLKLLEPDAARAAGGER